MTKRARQIERMFGNVDADAWAPAPQQSWYSELWANTSR
jgi:hypothetical protein